MNNSTENFTHGRKLLVFVFAFLCFLLFDQLTKWWVLVNLSDRTIPVVPGIFNLTLRKNTGSAFGIQLLNPSAHVVITITISLIFLFFVLRFLPEWKWWFYFGAGLFLSGAWGNLIDRLRFGFVVDFFEPSFWATFNVADLAIIAGLILVFINVWFQGSAVEKTKDQSL